MAARRPRVCGVHGLPRHSRTRQSDDPNPAANSTIDKHATQRRRSRHLRRDWWTSPAAFPARAGASIVADRAAGSDDQRAWRKVSRLLSCSRGCDTLDWLIRSTGLLNRTQIIRTAGTGLELETPSPPRAVAKFESDFARPLSHQQVPFDEL